MAKPTEKEIKTALRVLRFYDKMVGDILAVDPDDERTHEWSRGAEVWEEILSDDDGPEKVLLDYLEEVKAANS